MSYVHNINERKYQRKHVLSISIVVTEEFCTWILSDAEVPLNPYPSPLIE